MRRFEVWVPDANGASLRFKDGFYYGIADLADAIGTVRIGSNGGAIGHAWTSKTPSVVDGLSADDANLRPSREMAKLRSVFALPIMDANGGMKAVLAWYS